MEKNFGKLFKYYRKLSGLTQKQVAEKFGKPVLEPKDATEWGTAYPEFYDLVWESSNEDA